MMNTKIKSHVKESPLVENFDIIPESEDISREDTIHINRGRNSLFNSTKRCSITLDVDKLKNIIDENDSNDNNKDDRDNAGSDNENNNEKKNNNNKIDEKNYNEALLRKA